MKAKVASYSDWPVAAFVVPREQAQAASHDPVPIPNPGQQLDWIEQLDAEEPPLPFEDDGS